MFKRTQGIYQSSLFKSPNIIHGFSTKKFGDMRNIEKRKAFLSALHIQEESLVWQEQVHGDGIQIVTENDCRKIVHGVDGLVFCHPRSSPLRLSEASRGSREIFLDSRLRGNDRIGSGNDSERRGNDKDNSVLLSVHTADCVPLLFYDPISQIIGAAHAGWRGTVLHIGQKMIKTMEKLGSKTSDIRVVIGPHICGKCYCVDKERAELFRKEFTPHSRNRNFFDSGNEHLNVIREKEGKYFVDLGKANYADLINSNIDPTYIDFDPSLCTYSKNDELYSFRRSGLPLEGEILGVIGFT